MQIILSLIKSYVEEIKKYNKYHFFNYSKKNPIHGP